MADVALSGQDTININGTILTDQADGNVVELTFPGEIMKVKTGKNGNTIYAQDFSGRNAEAKIRVIRGSNDDQFLNNLLINQDNNAPSAVLVQGEFIKKIGDGQGNVTNDTYIISNGVFTKMVEAKDNAEGDTEQSVAIYTLKFSLAPRALT